MNTNNIIIITTFEWDIRHEITAINVVGTLKNKYKYNIIYDMIWKTKIISNYRI